VTSGDDGMPVHLPILWFILGLVIMHLNVVATFALYKSKSIVVQIRMFSLQLTCIEIIFGVYLSTLQILKMADVHTPCRLRWYLHWVIFLTRGITIAFLSLDRFFCIYFSMQYVQYVSRRFVFVVCLIAWIVSFCVCAQMFILVPDMEQYNCEDVRKTKNIEFTIVSFFLCLVAVIVSYVGIYFNVKKHERQLGNVAYQSTMKILVIVLVFFITILPGYIYNVFIWISPEMFYDTRTIRKVCQATVCLGSLATPFLYVLRFKVCRMQLIKSFCCLCKSRQDENERQLKLLQAPYLENLGVTQISVTPMNM